MPNCKKMLDSAAAAVYLGTKDSSASVWNAFGNRLTAHRVHTRCSAGNQGVELFISAYRARMENRLRDQLTGATLPRPFSLTASIPADGGACVGVTNQCGVLDV